MVNNYAVIVWAVSLNRLLSKNYLQSIWEFRALIDILPNFSNLKIKVGEVARLWEKEFSPLGRFPTKLPIN